MRPLTAPLLMGMGVLTAHPNSASSIISSPSKAKAPRPQHQRPQQQSSTRHPSCCSNQAQTNSSTFRSSCAADAAFVCCQLQQRLSRLRSPSAPPWGCWWGNIYIMALPRYGEGSRIGGGGNQASEWGEGGPKISFARIRTIMTQFDRLRTDDDTANSRCYL